MDKLLRNVYFDGERFHMWFTGCVHYSQLIAMDYVTTALDTSNVLRIEDDLFTRILTDIKLFYISY